MGSNILKHEKQFNINSPEHTPEEAKGILNKIHSSVLLQVTNLEPILARYIADHLIKADDEGNLTWKSDLLKQMTTDQLTGLRNVLENKQENQKRKY